MSLAFLPQKEMDVLLALDGLVVIEPPSFVDGMVTNMPPGPFVGSPALDKLFLTNDYSATVALDAQTRTVVFSGLFGN